MVKNASVFFFIFFIFFPVNRLFTEIFTINVLPNTILEWNIYSNLKPQDTLNIILSDPSGEVTLYSSNSIAILCTIQCNGKLRVSSEYSKISHKGNIIAPYVILEACNISFGSSAIIDASGLNAGGEIYIGGGWHGDDNSIKNANIISASYGAQFFADALANGDGGIIVFWAEKSTICDGTISACSKGTAGNGGDIEISSRKSLFYDGTVDVSSQNGLSGHVYFDPLSITIQTSSPDINGNGSGLDITNINQLNDATTTPVGFPNANSIITAGALNSLLTNNVTVTLAAQQFISVNAPINTASTNVTLILSAPIANLNSSITLGGGGILTGAGVATVNVGNLGFPQNGVDVISPGGIVNLATATYVAPVTILNKNLILNGNGQGNTIVQVTGAVPSYSGRNPAIYVQGGNDVIIQNLTVDCNNIGFPTNANITGIFYRNAGGTIFNDHVTQVANSPPPYGGGQQGAAILAVATAGGPFVININDNFINLFQKAAIVAGGAALTANINNNTITGIGLSTPAAIGIQMSDGIGTITGNSVTGLIYSNHQSSAAILAFNTSPNLTISGNDVNNSDEGIVVQNVGAETVIQNNIIQNSGDTAILIYDTSGIAHILDNSLFNNGGLAGVTGINSSIFIFTTTSQTFDVANNSILPASGTIGLYTQGFVAGQFPSTNLLNNTFIDP